MTTGTWHRAVARVVLTTFLTGIVGCGDTTREAASSTTTVPEAVAQVADTTPPPPEPPSPPPTPPSTMPEQAPEQLSKEELRDLVAPVALYPDVVLSSLLPATTYPEQVRDAAQFVGDAEVVDQVPEDRGWDGSVVALLQFPDVVRWLDANPAWTDQMGQAVTYQQGDVLEAIQEYRKAVKNAGNLQSNQYQKVRTGGSNQDIYIEPARPDVVYVPSYDPVVAVQPQPAPEPGINPWIAFGGGAVVGALGAWALYSIFDDDDDDNYYYGGRRGRRIRGYDNYYYYRGRRPRTVVWAPRQRPYRRVENWRRPRRLEYVERKARPGRRAALRPPTKRAGAPPPLSTEIRRDQRGGQGNRQEQRRARDQRQEQKALEQQQRQDQQRQQRQERQERQQQQKAQQQQQRQDRQQRQQQQRQERQQREQQQRQERQQRQQEQRQQRQQRQEQEQQQRQQQRQERQQRQQQQQEQRRERRQEQQSMKQQGDGGGGRGGGGGGNGGKRGGGGGGGGKKNKKQGNE